MPVVDTINLTLDIDQVLRRQGILEKSRLRPQMEKLTGELISEVSSNRLLQPCIAYEIFPLIGTVRDMVRLEGGHTLCGSIFASIFPEAKALGVAVGTIGAGLEKRVTGEFNRKESLRATLLDGIGSAAVDVLSEAACRLIREEASSRGYQSSSPVNPGMPGFPLSEQERLLVLIPAGEIGVRLSSGGMMVPRKSASLVIGMGAQMSTWTPAEVCARCHLAGTCRYRVYAEK